MTIRVTRILKLLGVLVVFAVLMGAAGPVSAVRGQAYNQEDPTLVYNPARDQYLLIWSETRSDAGADLYWRVLQTNGLPLGGHHGPTFRLTREAGDDVDPMVVYNPVRSDLLVVWSAYRGEENGWDIHGQLLHSFGGPKGRPIEIFVGPGNQIHPAVAFNSHREDFVVVWADDQNADTGYDIMGQVLFTNARPRGRSHPITSVPGDQIDPVIASHGDRFLVLWTEDQPGDRDVRAKQLQAPGLPIGGAEDGGWVIAGGPGNQEAPALAATSIAIWQSDINAAETGIDLFSNALFPNGFPRGRNLGITDAEADQSNPTLAYNPRRDEFLVVWVDDRNENEDLFGLRVRPRGHPKGRDYAVVLDG